MKGVKKYKLPVVKYVSPGDLTSTVVTVVNNTALYIRRCWE